METIDINEIKGTEVEEATEENEAVEVEKDWKQEAKEFFSEHTDEIVKAIIKGLCSSLLTVSAIRCLNAGRRYFKAETKCANLWYDQQK